MILDVKNPGKAVREIRLNNQIWEEFSESWLFSDLNRLHSYTDSIKELRSLLEESRFIAYSSAKDSSMSWSFILPLPIDFDEDRSIELIQSLDSLEWNPESASGSLNIQGKRFLLSFKDGLVLLSSSAASLDEMASVLENNNGLQTDESFSYAYQVGGKNKTLNFYFQISEMESWILDKLNLSLSRVFDNFSKMGDWTELDLLLKPNSIQLNGFSVGQIRLEDSKEQDLASYYKAMASKTAYYYPNNIVESKFNDVHSALIDSLSAGQIPGLKKMLEDCQSCFGMTFAKKSALDSNVTEYVLVKASDCPALGELLKATNSSDTIVAYPDLIVRALSLPFSELGLVHKSINDMHLFAASADDIDDYNDMVKGLNENKNFKSFKENLLASSSYSMYISPYRMKNELGFLFNDDYRNFWNSQSSYVEHFEGLSWQFTQESKSRVFHHIYLRYNSDFQEDQNYLWVAKGDARFNDRISLFKNHYTQADEILVQDENNRIHLFNNKGKKLWETRLDGPINSEVFIVDRYRNDKYQILLSTQKSVYLIDRKGRDTEGFPLRYEAGLSAGIACIDYDKKKNYRLMVPLNDGRLLNLNIDGKKVKGWNYSKGSKVMNTPLYFRVAAKDHILLYNADGTLYTINRRGDLRKKISENFTRLQPSSLGVFPGSTEEKSLIVFQADTSLWSIRLNGKANQICSLDSSKSLIQFGDLDGDRYPEILAQSRSEIRLLEFAGDEVLSMQDSNTVHQSIQTLGDQIYAVSGSDGLLQFYKGSQKLKTELRVPNARVLKIDVNQDKQEELLYIGNDGKLYCLRFEFAD